MTYNELIYMVLDEIKAASDDSFITEEHARFLLSKYRNLLLYQQYKDGKKHVNESNYQTICLNLEEYSAFEDTTCSTSYLRSVEEVPSTLSIGINKVFPLDYYQGNIILTSKERMKYVGSNKYLKNVIYASLGEDNHLYMKSSNPQYKYLEKVKYSGLFEDIDKAMELSCNEESSSCDIDNSTFPIEGKLVPSLIQSVVRELLGVSYKPSDIINNANDDLFRVGMNNSNNQRQTE